MLLNRFSHIVFGTTLPEPEEMLGFTASGDYAPTSSAVILKPGESYSVYIPKSVAFNITDTALDLNNHKLTALAIANVGGATNVAVPGLAGGVLLAFTIPGNTTIDEGYYRLRMSTSLGNVYSNRLFFKPNDADSMSCLFSYANIDPVGPIPYDLAALADFRNILRLKCNITKPQVQTEVTTYQQESVGTMRTVETITHRFTPFSCPYVDAFADEGWSTLLAHKSIVVNNNDMGLKTGYNVTTDSGALLGTGSFELWNTAFSIINRC